MFKKKKEMTCLVSTQLCDLILCFSTSQLSWQLLTLYTVTTKVAYQKAVKRLSVEPFGQNYDGGVTGVEKSGTSFLGYPSLWEWCSHISSEKRLSKDLCVELEQLLTTSLRLRVLWLRRILSSTVSKSPMWPCECSLSFSCYCVHTWLLPRQSVPLLWMLSL